MAKRRHSVLEWRHWVYCSLALIALAIYATALCKIYNPANPRELWIYIGLFLGPTLIAAGWIVTNEVTTKNSRKQHTITLLAQYFTNQQRIDDKETLNQELPFPNVL